MRVTSSLIVVGLCFSFVSGARPRREPPAATTTSFEDVKSGTRFSPFPGSSRPDATARWLSDPIDDNTVSRCAKDGGCHGFATSATVCTPEPASVSAEGLTKCLPESYTEDVCRWLGGRTLTDAEWDQAARSILAIDREPTFRCVIETRLSPRRETRFIELATGVAHTCGLTTEGEVLCWGRNELGQLGDGSFLPRFEAVRVRGLPPVVTLTAAGNATCAIGRDRGLWCWGENALGQLGNGSKRPSPTPTPVSRLSKGVEAVSMSERHACALQSGQVFCWGSNEEQALGSGPSGGYASFVPLPVPDLRDVIGVDVGSFDSCAQKRDASIVCWGNSDTGIFKPAQGKYSMTPVEVFASASQVRSFAVGSHNICALLGNGDVICAGQFFTGSETPATPYGMRYGKVGGWAAPLSRISGDYDFCGLLVSGGIQCFGYGELGTGGDGPRPVSLANPVGLNQNVVQLSTTSTNHCALLNSGSVWCWGDALGATGTLNPPRPERRSPRRADL